MKLTEEQRKIVEDNHNLIYGYCYKYNLNVEEYYGDLAIALCEAAQTYKEEKSKFTTYVYLKFGTTIKYLLRNQEKDRYKANYNIIGLDEKISIENPNISDISADLIIDDVTNNNDVGKLLLQGYNQSEIGKILHYSQASIFRRIKKLRKTLMECVL